MPPSVATTKEPLGPAVDMEKKHAINTDATNSSKYSPEEIERQKKLGIFLVQNNISAANDVFGADGEAIMAAVGAKKVPDLLLVNRVQDDPKYHPKVWYKPWTWFTGGAQVSPLRWADRPFTEGDLPPPSTQQTPAPIPEPEEPEEVPEAELKPIVKKRSGLPPVNMEPLTAKAVDGLTPAVQTSRQKLLDAETNIHKVLQGIEDTRYRYLVPSTELQCERQVAKVAQCYERENANASKKRAAIKAAREAELESGISNQVHSSLDVEKPIVLFDVLKCADLVKNLKECTQKMITDYSFGSLEEN